MEVIRVLRGNRERLIPSMEKEKYLSDGYSVIDESGAIIEQGVKSNHTLKTELDFANKRIAELEAENVMLKGMGDNSEEGADSEEKQKKKAASKKKEQSVKEEPGQGA